MGVMPCSKEGCTTILCDRYSTEFGYICNDCYEELKQFLACKYSSTQNLENLVTTFLETPQRAQYDVQDLVEGFVEGTFINYIEDDL
jgi:hypothetical protein